MDNRASDATNDASRPAPRGTSLNLGNMVALAVSVFALLIGAYQTRLMQSQAHASAWPYLTMGYTYTNGVDKDAYTWTIDNNGVGPAKVEYVTLSLDGKPIRRWDEVLGAFGFKELPSMATTQLESLVIVPNTNRETTIPAIKLHSAEVAAQFKQATHRFAMDICYCSVYDDCWIAHWQKAKVDPVEHCDASGLVPFEE
jgi:hypothetical protein